MEPGGHMKNKKILIQVGKLIIIDVEKALELWKGLKEKPKYKY